MKREYIFLKMLTVLFIGLKLTHHIDWSWGWVLAPHWVILTFAANERLLERRKKAKEAAAIEAENNKRSGTMDWDDRVEQTREKRASKITFVDTSGGSTITRE